MLSRLLSNLLPTIVGLMVAFFAWLALGAMQSHYDGLNRADEIRIVDGMQRYTDRQTEALKAEMDRIRSDIARLQDLQTKILLELQRASAKK